MATVIHRFINEMQINYPCKWLILGTFNPGIICNNDGTINFAFINENPEVNIFYARPRNHFWYYLPNVFGYKSLKHNHNNIGGGLLTIKRREFLTEHSIVLCDIIRQVSNVEVINLKNFEDAQLENGEIIFYETIKKIQLCTPQCVFTTFGQNQNTPNINHHFEDIQNFCSNNGIHFANLPTPGGYGPMIYGNMEEVLQLWKQAFWNSGHW